MLKSFTLDEPYRAIEADPFGPVGFGKRTVVYGHNGSGKSTLAEVLLRIGEGNLERQVKLQKKTRGERPQTVPPQTALEDVVLSVFNAEYIEQNLKEFLDGHSAAAIVTLGGGAIAAKEAAERLQKDIKKAKGVLATKQQLLAQEQKSTKSLVRTVQNSIETALKAHDGTYNKHKYNEPAVRRELQKAPTRFPTDAARDEYLRELTSPAPQPVKEQEAMNFPWISLSREVDGVLKTPVQSVLLEALKGDVLLQQWIKEGLTLHVENEECSFCSNSISPARWTELQLHFDDSRQRVQDAVTQLRDKIRTQQQDLNRWSDSLPEPDDMHPTLREEFANIADLQREASGSAREFLCELDALLESKYDEPERLDLGTDRLQAPTFDACGSDEITSAHNQLCATSDVRRSDLATKVFTGIVGSSGMTYRSAETKEAELSDECSSLLTELQDLDRQLRVQRAAQFSNQEMADQINSDLASVYGRNHLRVEVTDGGKSYKCFQGDRPARHLSEGERNSLALIYFLRHLEDEKTQIDPAKRVVVVDDPSSSLDRESVYATHSWLLKQLRSYGQYVILTHDFELLRLFLGSLSNQISKSRGIIKDGNKNVATPAQKEASLEESHFPRVAFLEVAARESADGTRSSRLELIPEHVVNYISEYHYLFDRVLRGVEQEGEQETLFLLPNAARRLLESFCRFKIPGEKNLQQAMERLVGKEPTAEFRDVYDFCNKHSHGEGRELDLNLDHRTVHKQISRAMEFMKHIDLGHYEAMFEATGRKLPKVPKAKPVSHSASS